MSFYGLIGQYISEKEKEKSHKEEPLRNAQSRLDRAEAGQTHSQELNQELEQLRSDVLIKNGDMQAVAQEIQDLVQKLTDFASECIGALCSY